tara:strand:+ start:20506 stop:21228 length:723 start_codon:yes stop_codon:yes gene_type:complete
MIKFFRHIRKSLLGEGKTKRYFLYGIGEIALVVIGILIALQINNWNEKRKLKSIEIILLTDISEDLKESYKEINEVMKFNDSSITKNKIISNALISDLPYFNQLDSLFAAVRNWSSPYLTYTAYETLKSKGIDLITNKELKKGIINIYESEYAYLTKDYDGSEWLLAQTVYPLTIKHIRKIDYFRAKPNDYELLKKNDEFINMLNEVIDMRQSGIYTMKRIAKRTQNLIDSINKEIESRK